jgi:PAS domain S-box-containing protein
MFVEDRRVITDLHANIIDCLADAVIFSDVDGIVRVWNSAAERLFGFAAAEALGRTMEVIIPERLRAAHWRGFEAAIRTGQLRLSGRPTLTRAVHKDGRRLYVEMSFALVRSGDTVIGATAVARDVTEREEQARARNAPGSGAGER